MDDFITSEAIAISPEFKSERISTINSLINGPYSENKLNEFLEKLMNIITGGKDEEIIDLDMFKKMFEQYNILSIENVRDYLLAEI